jgi:outer membrane protein assembly factor BamB
MYVTRTVELGRAGGIYVDKLNRDGSTAWSTRITPVTIDAVNAVALSPKGELFVAGATFLQLGTMSFGQQDAFVVKIDKATGDKIWAAQAGSRDSDFATAMAIDDDGNIYVAGETFFPTDPNDPGIGNFDPFAMKFDSQGTLLSTWRAGTDQDEFVTSLVADSCGHVYVGGQTKGTLVHGVPGNAGGWDMFVYRPNLQATSAARTATAGSRQRRGASVSAGE